MSSRKQVTLRPPPNVDFVHGYPGIAPGQGRAPAEVMGSVEVRFGKEGSKTKWVRIAMRKVELLPGGAIASHSPDFIGQTPQDLWTAQGDHEILVAKDFPFRIRLPETIPPSIGLEKDAGIRYELVASVCVKGKKGLLRKDSSMIIEDTAVIQIDKHELHSTWPIYNQPDHRSVARDQLTLTASRSQSCFSPGDRVTVTATLQSNAFNATHLRAFEFALLETITFSAGQKAKTGKKAAPQAKVNTLGERKVPVNNTMFGGMHHVAELGCVVPPEHPNATINSARHIDVAHKIVVKAVLDHMKPYVLELPVTLSNWQRNTSTEIVNRIGYAPNLSLGPPPPPGQLSSNVIRENTNVVSSPTSPQAPTGPIPGRVPVMDSRGPEAMTYPGARPLNTVNGTLPVDHSLLQSADEFGRQRPHPNYQAATTPMRRSAYEEPTRRTTYEDPSRPLSLIGQQFINGTASPHMSALQVVPENGTPVGHSTNSEDSNSRHMNATSPSRFTVVNVDHDNHSDAGSITHHADKEVAYPSAEMEKAKLRQQEHKDLAASPNGNRQSTLEPQSNHWPTAEEEKRRIFEGAQAKATQTQSRLLSEVGGSSSRAPSKPASQTSWPSAEDEKRRLFEAAQKNVRKTQGERAFSMSFSPSGSVISDPTITSGSGSSSSSNAPKMSPAAALYSNAMASVKPTWMAQTSPTSAGKSVATVGGGSSEASHSSNGGQVQNSPQRTNPKQGGTNVYPTAEEEKAALRYREAKEAVDRNLSLGVSTSTEASSSSHIPADVIPSSAPIPYDELFPERSPKPLVSSNVEGETSSSTFANRSPPQTASSSTGGNELLYSPSRNIESPSSPQGKDNKSPRKASLPTPPMVGGTKLLSAAEEKARLKAQYAAEAQDDAGPSRGPDMSESERSLMMSKNDAFGNSSSGATGDLRRDPSISVGKRKAVIEESPPPLMPRPPAHYIQETQEEDEKLQYEERVIQETTEEDTPWSSVEKSPVDFGLRMRPFSPIDLGVPGLGESMSYFSPPPPLPPKVPLQ